MQNSDKKKSKNKEKKEVEEWENKKKLDEETKDQPRQPMKAPPKVEEVTDE